MNTRRETNGTMDEKNFTPRKELKKMAQRRNKEP